MRKSTKKKKFITTEIEIPSLKGLTLFETIEGKYCELGFVPTYTRIPGGLVRTVINMSALNQVFIPLPDSWFVM